MYKISTYPILLSNQVDLVSIVLAELEWYRKSYLFESPLPLYSAPVPSSTYVASTSVSYF